MNLKQVLLGGIVGGIVILVLGMLVDAIIQFVLPYNVLELGGMRSIEDPIMILFFAHGWVLAFAMAIMYQYVKPAFSGSFLDKGKMFGLLMWLVYSIPGYFLVWSSMDYPLGFHISGLVAGLVYMIVTGIVIAKFAE